MTMTAAAPSTVRKPCPVEGCEKKIPLSWRRCRDRHCRDREHLARLAASDDPLMRAVVRSAEHRNAERQREWEEREEREAKERSEWREGLCRWNAQRLRYSQWASESRLWRREQVELREREQLVAEARAGIAALGDTLQRTDDEAIELHTLMAEQGKDAKRTWIQHGLSLDRPQVQGKTGIGFGNLGDVLMDDTPWLTEWRDPTFDAYLRQEEERAAEQEWELETLNRGHGYAARTAVPYGWEIMEQDKPLQERIARSTPGGRMHTDHKRSHSPRAKQLGMRGSGNGVTRRGRD